MVRHNLLSKDGHDGPQSIGQSFGPILTTGHFSGGAYVKIYNGLLRLAMAWVGYRKSRVRAGTEIPEI